MNPSNLLSSSHQLNCIITWYMTENLLTTYLVKSGYRQISTHNPHNYIWQLDYYKLITPYCNNFRNNYKLNILPKLVHALYIKTVLRAYHIIEMKHNHTHNYLLCNNPISNLFYITMLHCCHFKTFMQCYTIGNKIYRAEIIPIWFWISVSRLHPSFVVLPQPS